MKWILAIAAMVTLATPLRAAEPAELFSAIVPAPTSGVSAARFAPNVAAMTEADKGLGIVHGGVLFIGSSMIHNWTVTSKFPAPVGYNRGIAGCAVPDLIYYYPQLMSVYRPASVVVYAGANDIARGDAPARVSRDILTLIAKLRADLPRAHIVFLSVKPSPARWDIWPKMQAVNDVVRAESESTRAFDYLDVATPLLGADGAPDPQYFFGDHEHFNPKGYAVWNAIVGDYLKTATKPWKKPRAR